MLNETKKQSSPALPSSSSSSWITHITKRVWYEYERQFLVSFIVTCRWQNFMHWLYMYLLGKISLRQHVLNKKDSIIFLLISPWKHIAWVLIRIAPKVSNEYLHLMISWRNKSAINLDTPIWSAVMLKHLRHRPGSRVVKLLSCSAHLSMKFSLLINMKMPTFVGIFIFIIREIFMLSYV